MKSWLIISLILSSFMIHEAQGMNLRRGSLPADKNDIHQRIVPSKRSSNYDGTEEDEGPQVKKFSGRSRKLIVSSTSSTTKTAKNVKNEENKALPNNVEEGSSNQEKIGKKEEKLSVNSSSQNQATTEVYPDVMDIAGMDYSQARRRPPIHN